MTAGSKIYANAVAKYNEGKLLDAEKLKRITEASYPDALKMLYDYGWGEGLPIEEADAEKLTAVETSRLISFVIEYCPDERLKDFLLCPYLFNNIKAAYKSRFIAVGKEAYFPGFTEETDAVKAGEYNSLPNETATALTTLDNLAADEKLTSRAVDIAITGAMFARSLSLANKLGRTAGRFVKRQIDMTNILTAFRCRRQGTDESVMKTMIIDGGRINNEQLSAILSLDAENALRLFDGEYYDCVERLFEKGDFVAFERETDDMLYAFAVKDRDNMVSSDPFTGYFYAKKAEIKTVKTVLTCLKNDARSEINKRLRRLYD